jgi:hypothetical protein
VADPDENEGNELEGWLCTDDACNALGGISAPTLTRLAKTGQVRRVVDPNSTSPRPRYLYDPEQIEELRAAGTCSPNPAGENVLNGGASMLRAGNDIALRMADKVLAMADRVTQALDSQTRASKVQQESLLGLFERLEARTSTLEQAHVTLIQAREAALSEQHSRELEADEIRASTAMKEKAIMGRPSSN